MNYRMLAAATVISMSALGAASCSDDDGPGPTPLPTTFVFTTTLLPNNEVPPVTNADSTASGAATVTMTVTRDSAGTITSASTVFAVTVTGFAGATTLTAMHIHNNVAGQTGNVFVDAALGSGTVALTNGAATFSRTAPATTVAQAEAIIASPAGHYVNVHTALNPGGAIRGQLTLQSSTAQ